MAQIIDSIIEELKSGSALILLHHNADVDAIGSAFALSTAFKEMTISANQSVSLLSKKLLKVLRTEVKIDPPPEYIANFEKVVILDTSTPSQLGGLIKYITDPIVIDHHTETGSWDDLAKLYYCDDTKTSCAEIVYQIIKTAGKNLDRESGLALLAGIITDTARFKFANLETLRTFIDILTETGIELKEVLQIVETGIDFDISQKIAHLKSAQRLVYENIKNNLVVTSTVGAFESSACKNLLFIGADIAFVGSQKDREIRISAKAKPHLVKRGLHIGKFMNEVGKDCGCDGGGHAGVGGLNGVGDIEAILKICVGKIREWFYGKGT